LVRAGVRVRVKIKLSLDAMAWIKVRVTVRVTVRVRVRGYDWLGWDCDCGSRIDLYFNLTAVFSVEIKPCTINIYFRYFYNKDKRQNGGRMTGIQRR
jgi:hypothetical protein